MTTKIAVPVYAATLILSAFLLFSMQLLFGKMLLPLLGGSPSMWNTAMVFFQALLLAGYAYAHATSQKLDIRTQAILHLAILLFAAIFLPFSLPESAGLAASGSPALWQLGIMTITVGAPFFIISASAPMIQRWFTGTGHPDAANPYFLYAASNIGSMAALLSYPVVIEPLLSLHGQNVIWACGYVLLILLTAFCAFLVWKNPAPKIQSERAVSPAPKSVTKLAWVALAFIPSSLMLGLTTYITTDVASAPLLWILPLTLYLSTFIIVFARREIISMDYAVTVFTAFFMILVFMMSSTLFISNPIFFLVSQVVFFFSCLICHKKLADIRPSADHLTSFYMYMSLGGVLGGAFNAFVAPILFLVPLEYTAALCAVVIVRCVIVSNGKFSFTAENIFSELKSVTTLMAIAAGAVLYFSIVNDANSLRLLAGIVIVLTMNTMQKKPFSYAVFVSVMLLAMSPALQLFDPKTLKIERNFFGIIRVVDTSHTRQFMHGTTLHGAQPTKPEDRLNSITYYDPEGSYGNAFGLVTGDQQKIGVIGLGIGSVACFTHPGRSFDFYEIDPDVAAVAENRDYFTYLSDCGSPYRIIIGDGRLKIAEAPDQSYDMIVVDAFSSDNVPVHIITTDALDIYGSKLKPEGFLFYHISNRHLNLEPVIKAIADSAGYHAVIKFSLSRTTPFNPDLHYASSVAAILTKDAALIATLKEGGWADLIAPAGYRPWTDDYANIAAALNIFSTIPSRFQEHVTPASAQKKF